MTLDELEKLLTKATPGPWGTWGVEGDDETWTRGVQGPLVKREDRSCFNINVAEVKSGGCEEADADLIAAARNALPDLIKIARAAANYARMAPPRGHVDEPARLNAMREALRAVGAWL